MRRLTFLAAASVFCWTFVFPAGAEWTLARDPHFEVYSEAGPQRARAALTRFEELRAFFDRNRVVQAGSGPEKTDAVRVIEFSSKREYDSVKVRAMSDAYYTGMGDRDYIVMPMPGKDDVSVAAHEYGHFVLHSRGLTLPAWLNEGLAEIFSTVHITSGRCELGGPIAQRVETLHRHPWLSVAELLTAEPNRSARETRSGVALFYAESWALTDMLASSPEYALHFNDLIGLLNSGAISSQQALAKVYGKSSDEILADAQGWIRHDKSSRRTLFSAAPETVHAQVTAISEFQAHAVIADLLFATGEWDRAEQMDQALLRQSPDNPEILAALGAVALRKGDRGHAVEYWRKAMSLQMNDAALCYRYALLADEMGLPAEEVERALERAIAIRKNFDDARYRLALYKNNAGEYEAAAYQLQSMAKPSGERAYGYWTALAYALSELGKRDEAENAAKEAAHFARSPEERARTAALAYVAKTDLAVRFARGSDGSLQLTTTRVPHGTADFNPFIEADDRIQVATGKLREVQCGDGQLTGFRVESKTGALMLSVPDPRHVMMRNSPSEFSCGPQPGKTVQVEYAAGARAGTGLLRGMEFQ